MKRKKAARTAERTKQLVYVALFAALTAILSQISIPLPSGVPLTLQTFAVAAAGFFLGGKKGTAATAVWIALGACGVPVFASFTGGAYKLVSLTGGFIWGFLLLAALCGMAAEAQGRGRAVLLAAAGLALCHMIGVGQYALVTGNPLGASALAVSVPYIAKDILSVLLAAMLVRAVTARARLSHPSFGTAFGRSKHLS